MWKLQKYLLFFTLFFVNILYASASYIDDKGNILKSYIKEKKQKVEYVAKKYNRYNHPEIQSILSAYTKYINALNTIRKTSVTDAQKAQLFSAITNDLDIKHKNIKNILKEAKREYDQKILLEERKLSILTFRLQKWLEKISQVLDNSHHRKFQKINAKIKTKIKILQQIRKKDLIKNKKIKSFLKQQILIIREILSELYSLMKK